MTKEEINEKFQQAMTAEKTYLDWFDIIERDTERNLIEQFLRSLEGYRDVRPSAGDIVQCANLFTAIRMHNNKELRKNRAAMGHQ
jgi:hypothetical protein